MNRIQALGVSLTLLVAAAAEAGAANGSSYFRTRGPFVEPPYALQKAIQPTNQTPSLPRQGAAASMVNGQSSMQKSITSSGDRALPAPTQIRSPYRYPNSSGGGPRLPPTYLANPSSSREAPWSMTAPLGMDKPGAMSAFLTNLLSSSPKPWEMTAPLGMDKPGSMDRPGSMTSGR